MDCSPPGSSVHGILQARILEWVVIAFSRGSSPFRDGTRVSCIGTGEAKQPKSHAGRVSEVSLASPALSSDGSTHPPLQHSHCLGSTWKRPFRLLLPPLFQLPRTPALWGPPLPALSVGIRRPEIAWCRRAECCGLGMTPYRTKCRSSWVKW